MKKTRFTEPQIAFILKQAEQGSSVGEICRKTGISEQTFYRWKQKYSGMLPSEMRKYKQLEEEILSAYPNHKLFKLFLNDYSRMAIKHQLSTAHFYFYNFLLSV